MPASFINDFACANFRLAQRFSRREVLRIGALTGFGLALPDLLRACAAAAPVPGTFGRAKSVILLFLNGGHAQQETWDPKPDAPAEPRGQFGAIATSVPGTFISELLPQSAKQMHRVAIIRSLHHRHPDHVQACLPAFTGHHHPDADDMRNDPPPSARDFPPFGAVLDSLRPARELPTWVQVGPLMRRNSGGVLHGQLPGFLGRRHGPFVVDQDLLPERVKIQAVSSNATTPTIRLTDRRRLLNEVDGQRRQLDEAAECQSFDAFQQRALNLLTSSASARAFDIAAEPAALRDRYGRHPFGQYCLLARRLAEAGVPMINVHYCRTPSGSWDTHSRHFPHMKNSLCPSFDQAFSALVEDLHDRRLLDQTLVIATAEFGRSPKVNGAGGRDHWPSVYSIALAGGGIAGGTVYGASDRIAAHPVANPHDPSDLAATVYHLLGVATETMVFDQARQPHSLIVGKKINGLLL